MEINRLLDHTDLKACSSLKEIENLCQEAIKYNFCSVCVNPSYVKSAFNFLKGSSVLVCTVVGFPLGANTIASKCFETKEAIANGAEEVDAVINISQVKNNNWDYLEEEIKELRKASCGKVLKLILEICYLTNQEIEKCCLIAKKYNVDFVKTSTGFATSGATVEAVSLMRRTVGIEIGVKASGGIRNLVDLNKMILAGANRIGLSSGVKVMNEIENKEVGDIDGDSTY